MADTDVIAVLRAFYAPRWIWLHGAVLGFGAALSYIFSESATVSALKIAALYMEFLALALFAIPCWNITVKRIIETKPFGFAVATSTCLIASMLLTWRAAPPSDIQSWQFALLGVMCLFGVWSFLAFLRFLRGA